MRTAFRAWAAAASLLLLPAALPAGAATGTLTVGATILSASNCRFQAGSGTLLDFGAINPSSGSNATASVTLVIKCTGSAATATYNISAGNGLYNTGPAQRRMRHATTLTEFLPYSLNDPLSATIPKNVVTNVVLSGTITPAQFGNALAGAFADSVVLTLLP